MNHYEVLGVASSAPAAELRRAYLAAARTHHPDFHAGAPDDVRSGHARRMQLVNDAWAVLGDPEARARYDRSLVESSARGRPRPGAQGAGASAAWTDDVRVPTGKGWTPRADDTGWQRDFATWAAEDERLPPDAPGVRAARGAVRVLPVAVFLLALVLGLCGLALSSRGLLAAAFGALFVSSGLFVLLPVAEMVRGRRRP